MEIVRRRLSNVANHLSPAYSSSNPLQVSIEFANSLSDSYHRVHGQVSSDPVVWRAVSEDSIKDFTDIIYEKAVGEAIAKVRIFS